MAQGPGVNMPRAVCLPLSGCVALERHSSLTLSSICKMGLTIKGFLTNLIQSQFCSRLVVTLMDFV